MLNFYSIWNWWNFRVCWIRRKINNTQSQCHLSIRRLYNFVSQYSVLMVQLYIVFYFNRLQLIWVILFHAALSWRPGKNFPTILSSTCIQYLTHLVNKTITTAVFSHWRYLSSIDAWLVWLWPWSITFQFFCRQLGSNFHLLPPKNGRKILKEFIHQLNA